jgi:hypothetical protein
MILPIAVGESSRFLPRIKLGSRLCVMMPIRSTECQRRSATRRHSLIDVLIGLLAVKSFKLPQDFQEVLGNRSLHDRRIRASQSLPDFDHGGLRQPGAAIDGSYSCHLGRIRSANTCGVVTFGSLQKKGRPVRNPTAPISSAVTKRTRCRLEPANRAASSSPGPAGCTRGDGCYGACRFYRGAEKDRARTPSRTSSSKWPIVSWFFVAYGIKRYLQEKGPLSAGQ